MNVLDLFSGIGGFSLGLERAGMRTVAFCEINPFCRQVLATHWPDVHCYEDVRSITAERLRTDGVSVDVICGGFPCQDISVAGKGLGLDGERSGLWKEYARIIGELRPRYIIVENVAALLGRGFATVLGDLSSIGYDAEWEVIFATQIGVPQRRERLWLIAYPSWDGCQPIFHQIPEHVVGYRAWLDEQGSRHADIDHKNSGSCTVSVLGNVEWTSIPYRERSGNNERLSVGLDRYRALGNSVVPQIPEIIGRAIMTRHAHTSAE